MLVQFLCICAFLMITHRRYERGLLAHANPELPGGHEEVDSIRLLPPAADDSRQGIRQISLGETLRLDDLGPIIINPDGTTRRISNWENLTKAEQDSSWRLISARNKKRIKALQERAEHHNVEKPEPESGLGSEAAKSSISEDIIAVSCESTQYSTGSGNRAEELPVLPQQPRNAFEDELVTDVISEDDL